METERSKPPRRAAGGGASGAPRGRARGQSGGGRGGRGPALPLDAPASAEPPRAASAKSKNEKPRPHRKGAASAPTGSTRGPATCAPPNRAPRTGALSMRKVLIRNLPHDWDEEKVVDFMAASSSGATRAHVWRFVPGRVRSNNRGVRCARMYLDFKKDADLAKSVIEKLDGYALTENEPEGPKLDVAFAPFQKITREKQRKDTKVGTLDRDPEYIAFMEALAKPKEKLPSADVVADAKDGDSSDKPLSALVLYLNTRKRDKKGKFGAKAMDKARASRVKAGKDSKTSKEKGKGVAKTKTRSLESGFGKDAAKPRKVRGKVPKDAVATDTPEPGAVRILSAKAPSDSVSADAPAGTVATAKASKSSNSKGPRRAARDSDTQPAPSDVAQDVKSGTGDRRPSKSQKSGANARRAEQPKKIFVPKATPPAT